MLSGTLPQSAPITALPWMVVLTDVRVWNTGLDFRFESSQAQAIHALQSQGVTVVLLSPGPASSLLSIQSSVGLRVPFICSGGSEIHLPVGHVDGARTLRAGSDWSVVELGRRDDVVGFCRAIDVLVQLLWRRREDGMVVGVSDRDSTILGCADVPILVRNPELDQKPLRQQFPKVYYTNASGAAGWTEAILGHSEA
jgi:predicted mannosyl-3-phosphoglycerate phosphatase (HAD superfamily)